MDRYFLRLTTDTEPAQTAAGLIDDAFDQNQNIHVSGEREGVSVDFELEITRVSKARENGHIMLRFSGVTQPDSHPYIARLVGAEEPATIELNVDQNR